MATCARGWRGATRRPRVPRWTRWWRPRTPGYYNPVALARAYAALGDVDRGLEWLRRAFEERTAMVLWVRQDPALAPLRADPRYAALDRQLRF